MQLEFLGCTSIFAKTSLVLFKIHMHSSSSERPSITMKNTNRIIFNSSGWRHRWINCSFSTNSGGSRFTWLASGRAGGTPKLCCTPGGESRHFPAGCRWRSGSGGPPFPPGWQTQRRTRRPDSLPPCKGARPPGRGPGTTSPSCRATRYVWGEKNLNCHQLHWPVNRYYCKFTDSIQPDWTLDGVCVSTLSVNVYSR